MRNVPVVPWTAVSEHVSGALGEIFIWKTDLEQGSIQEKA